jgi:hypothetical protein
MHDVRTVFRPNRSGTGCIQGVSRTTPGGGTAGWVEDADSSLVSDAVLYVLSLVQMQRRVDLTGNARWNRCRRCLQVAAQVAA